MKGGGSESPHLVMYMEMFHVTLFFVILPNYIIHTALPRTLIKITASSAMFTEDAFIGQIVISSKPF